MDLYRDFSFRNSKKSYRGIPVIAANMDTVGTFEMVEAISAVRCIWMVVVGWEGYWGGLLALFVCS